MCVFFLSMYHGQGWGKFWMRNDDKQERPGSVGLSRMENTYNGNGGPLKVESLLTVEKKSRQWTICLPGSITSLSFVGISCSTQTSGSYRPSKPRSRQCLMVPESLSPGDQLSGIVHGRGHSFCFWSITFPVREGVYGTPAPQQGSHRKRRSAVVISLRMPP